MLASLDMDCVQELPGKYIECRADARARARVCVCVFNTLLLRA